MFHHYLFSFTIADLEPGIQQHIWFLQELPGSPSHQGHVQTAGLSGHRCGDGGAAEGGQKPGEYSRFNMGSTILRPSQWKEVFLS